MNDQRAQHLLRMVLYSGGAAMFGFVFVKLALVMLLSNSEGITMGEFDVVAFIFTTIKITLMGVVLGVLLGLFTKPPEESDADRAKQGAEDTLQKLGIPNAERESPQAPAEKPPDEKAPIGDAAAATLEKLGIPNDGKQAEN